MEKYKIVTPEPYHWKAISGLIGTSIPNAIVSHLGIRFGSIYYQNIFQNTNTCCFIALEDSQNVIGVVLGSINSKQAKKMRNTLKMKLLIAANFRLLSPAFLKWILKGVLYKLIKRNEKKPDFPNSELVAIAVERDFRGTRLAHDLIGKMEDFMEEKGDGESYMILTEKENSRANSFYSKIGAEFVESYSHHAKKMNYWRKD